MKTAITEKNAGERIDKFLANETGESRSKVQKKIKDGLITINKKKITPHYSLKTGDVIDFLKNKKIEKELSKKKKEKSPKIEIIKTTKEYIVVNKPAGLTVHGADHIEETTLADILLKKYPELKKIGEDPNRPAIVHRLDKEASGLMVIPRTQDSFDSIKKQFLHRTVEKKYTALAYDPIEKNEDTINFPIDQARTKHRMAALPKTNRGEKNEKGKKAITQFKLIKNFINYALLKVGIKTGRTHQIRVHMSAYGHPLVGDNLYGTQKTKIRNKKLGVKRIFLVADELSFIDLAGEKQNFKIPLPDELNNILGQIK